MKTKRKSTSDLTHDKGCRNLAAGIRDLIEAARLRTIHAANALMTAAYWEVGRRIVEFEQQGAKRAQYGKALLQNLSRALASRLGRGFSVDHLEQMRLFYLTYPVATIQERVGRKSETVSRKSSRFLVSKKSETVSRIFEPGDLNEAFALPWSHYVMLIRRVKSPEARAFYETEALRGGWSVRQLDRQISTQFYERTLVSKDRAVALRKVRTAKPGEAVSPEEQIKDPLILEFLNLKDEYSESELEEALIRGLEGFLLELGGDFAFIGRQRRLRIGSEWYRVDLVFYHRTLRCLVVIDLKLGKFTHADAGQMHLYLNYAREHWMREGENPPVGLILCAEHDRAVAHYALDGLPGKILAAEYKLALPKEKELVKKTKKLLEVIR